MSDPRRLIDDGATADEAALLRSWSSEGPSGRARAAALAIGGGGAATLAGGATAATGAAKAAETSVLVLAKYALLGSVVVGTIAIAAHSILDHAPASAPPATSPVAASPAPDHGLADAPAQAPASQSAVAETSEPPSIAPVVRVAPQPSHVAPAAPHPSNAAPAPRSDASARIDAPPAAEVTTSSPRSTLAAEVAEMEAARHALNGGDAARCLALLDAYDARYPGGALAQESRIFRIDALSRSGNRGAARELAAAFVRANPTSPHAANLRSRFPDITNP